MNERQLLEQFKEQLADYILERPALFTDIINSLPTGQKQQWNDWINDNTDYHKDDIDYHLANFNYLEYGLTNRAIHEVVNYNEDLFCIISPLIKDDNQFISDLIVRGKDLIKGE